MDQRPPDPHLLNYLAENDAPCPSCGYNLRGLTTNRCPECDRALVLAVRLSEPRLGCWIGALTGAAAMMGFHGLFVLLFVIVALTRGGSMAPAALALMIVFGIMGAGALTMLIRHRRTFCNFAFPRRLATAVVVWLTAAASAALLPLVIR